MKFAKKIVKWSLKLTLLCVLFIIGQFMWMALTWHPTFNHYNPNVLDTNTEEVHHWAN